MEQKRVLSFPLRLCPSVRHQATDLARQEGISLNHFISLAVAEKISRMEHETWLRQQGKANSPGLFGQPKLLRHS
jgi:hypothetical protein